MPSRLDPQVRRYDLVAEGGGPVLEAQLATIVGSEGVHSVRAHRGVHRDGKRLLDWNEVRGGQDLRVYVFSAEPPPIEVNRDAILHDRDGLLAVNKPSWLPAQPTRSSATFNLHSKAETLVGERLWPINRLDRGTSGVTLFGRSAQVASNLGRAIARGEVEKHYLALIHGAPQRPSWRVEGHLQRAYHERHSKFEMADAGKRAVSAFECLRAGLTSLVRATPITGRTHQLRVHLSHGGTPIVGDDLYGDADDGAERMMLHAESYALPGGVVVTAAAGAGFT